MLIIIIIAAAVLVADLMIVRTVRTRVARRKHVADLQWRMSPYSYSARER